MNLECGPGVLCVQVLELLVQRDRDFQDLMQVAQQQGKVHQEMQQLEKEVEKRDSDIQQLQKQLKEAEHILVSPDWSVCQLFRWKGPILHLSTDSVTSQMRLRCSLN